MAKLMPSATYLASGEVVLIFPQAPKAAIKVSEIQMLIIVLRGPEGDINAS
jgi:hypothetical protein